MNDNLEDNPLRKLAEKARKKFTKKLDLPQKKTEKIATYNYVKFNKDDELKALKSKIIKLLSVKPDIQNPLFELSDKELIKNMDRLEREKVFYKAFIHLS